MFFGLSNTSLPIGWIWPDSSRYLGRLACITASIDCCYTTAQAPSQHTDDNLPSETAVVPVEALAPLIQTSCWHRESHSSPCGGVSRPLHPLRTMRATPANTTSQWPPKHLPAGSRLPLRSPWAPPSPHSAGKYDQRSRKREGERHPPTTANPAFQ